MNVKTALLAVSFAASSALAASAFAADAAPAPTTAEPSNAAKSTPAQVTPHNHMQDKYGVPVTQPAEKKSDIETTSGPKKTAHFHPRDGK